MSNGDMRQCDRGTLRVFSAIAVKGAIEGFIAPRFVSNGRDMPDFVWEPTKVLMQRLENGEETDFVILIDDSMDQLEREGLIDTDSRMSIAQASLGVAIRSGATHPDISNTKKFCDALVSAKGVAYSLAGASGIYFVNLLDRLGLSDAITGVTIPAGFTAQKIVDNEAELAVQQISELLTVDGVDVVGPFPTELQSVTNFSVAVMLNTNRTEAAWAFREALVTVDAAEAYHKTGLMPNLHKPLVQSQ
jgi:molybdate transport system substrate-binding protein